MRRNHSTSGSSRRSTDVGMDGLKLPGWVATAVGLPIIAPTVITGAAVVGGATALAPVVGMNYAVTPDPVKEKLKDIGEKWNVGAHSADWKNFANSALSITTVGLSDNKKIREKVKAVGEQWNFGNNSVDTLKSVANLASIAAAFTGVGTFASAMLGSSTLAQGAMTVAREYVRDRLQDEVIGKAAEELADPYIDHLIKKARRDQIALNAEEQKLRAMYEQQRPGVYSLMMMAVENPNALTQEQMQVIVNYQRDLEIERAIVENKPEPTEEAWENYYTRFLAEYGISWYPTNDPGNELWVGAGLPAAGTPSDIDGRTTAVYQISATERAPQSLQFTPELKAALDSLYPPKAT